MEMVPWLKVLSLSGSLVSGEEILIWDTRNVPADLQSLRENNSGHSTHDIPEILQVSHVSVVKCFKTLGYENRYDAWVPYEFNEPYFHV